ncbi:MAG TPA: hypothetical protein VK668_15905 [Mucilaginibacter sp.]|nr:hypothetical protein [Mucilaginibacter sp.]
MLAHTCSVRLTTTPALRMATYTGPAPKACRRMSEQPGPQGNAQKMIRNQMLPYVQHDKGNKQKRPTQPSRAFQYSLKSSANQRTV